MEAFAIAAGFAIPMLSGFFIAGMLAPRSWHWPFLLFQISLGAGLGLGVHSLLLYLWLVALGANGWFPMADGALAIALGWAWWRMAPDPGFGASPVGMAGPQERFLVWIAGGVFLVSLAAGAYVFVVNVAMLPHGRWDAWMTWSLRAKAMFYFGDEWKKAFSSEYSWTHTGYPLLLSGSIARIWMFYSKSVNPAVPQAIGLLFTFAIPAFLASVLYILRSRLAALVAGAFVMSAEMLYLQGSSLFADIPVGYYFFAAICMVYLAHEAPGKQAMAWTLAGLAAGLAAWTKNEGALFLIALGVSVGFIYTVKDGLYLTAGKIARMAVGAAAPLMALAWFKFTMPTHNFLVSANSPDRIIAKLTDLDRIIFVTFGTIYEILYFGGAQAIGIAVGAPLLAVLYLLARGAQPGAFRQPPALVVMAVLALSLAGYSFVFITSPQELKFLFTTTVGRLITQLWPMFVILIMMAVAGARVSSYGSNDNGGGDDRKV